MITARDSVFLILIGDVRQDFSGLSIACDTIPSAWKPSGSHSSKKSLMSRSRNFFPPGASGATSKRLGQSAETVVRPLWFFSLDPSLSISVTQRITTSSTVDDCTARTQFVWSDRHSAGMRPITLRRFLQTLS